MPLSPPAPQVISKAELAELKRGPKSRQKVQAHERVVILRGDQCKKDRTIESFAVTFLGQTERFGITSADRRHVANLINLFHANELVEPARLHLRRA